MRMVLRWIALVSCFAVYVHTAYAQSATDESSVSALSTGDLQALRESSLVFGAYGQGPTIGLTLETASGKQNVRLHPVDIRSDRYRSEVTATDGLHSDPTKVDLYAGTIDTKNSSDFVRLALITDVSGRELLRGFAQSDGQLYSLSSTKDAPTQLQVKQLKTTELRSIISHCGVEHVSESVGSPSDLATGNEHASAFKQAEIATEADYEYFQAYGSNQGSANANILAIMNGVTGLYEAQLGITFSVVYQHTWTVPGDPYTGTDSGALLDQFLGYWQSNVRGSHPYDVAHLWTGRDLDSNVVGLAYLSAVCSQISYGLSQNIGSSSYDVPLAAHEIGHNFNANHDTCNSNERWIMCPFLIQNSNQFSPASISSINSFTSAISCLAPVGGGGGTPPGGGSNHAPVLAAIGAKSATEYQTLTFSLSATDEDGDPLTYSVSPSVAGLTLTGSAVDYRPGGDVVRNGAASATVNVTFTVTDSGGLSDSETVVITVASNNLSPTIASTGTQNASQGTVFSYQLSGSDPDGDTITYTAPSGLPPGALLARTSGLFTWKPAGNQSGTFTIPIRVTDTYGATGQGNLVISVSTTPGTPALPSRHARPDFDGDGLADIAVYRPTTGQWFSQAMFSASPYAVTQWGLPGDIPVPGDYNGDRVTDFAVYRPAAHAWFIRYSGTGDQLSFNFGADGDIPAPGDYDGDGRWDIGVFRPSQGSLIYGRSSDGITATVQNVGGSGDIPVPCDYDGDAKFDAAVYRPSTGQWLIQASTGGSQTPTLGSQLDIPVPNDYNGDGRCEIAVWRPSDGMWYIGANAGIQFGLGEDQPVAADYDGDGGADIEVFRPSTATWFYRDGSGGASTRQLGLQSDLLPLTETYLYAARTSSSSTGAALAADNREALIYERSARTVYKLAPTARSAVALSVGVGAYILSADYDGDGANDLAYFGQGVWYINQTQGGPRVQYWGVSGDIPVVGDFDGDGKADITVYRPNDLANFSAWYVIRSSDSQAAKYQWGLSGDYPVPADFNGDGVTDPAVWRNESGYWYVMSGRSSQALQTVQWGLPGDLPRVGDFDGDGRADKAVWRASQGNWFVLPSSNYIGMTVQWGRSGDVPIPGRFTSGQVSDYAVYRPSAKAIYIRGANGAQQTIATGLSTSAQAVGLNPSEAIR
ncbi:MAG: M12 family metallo-peptidase [Bdellovibrionota bacterium]